MGVCLFVASGSNFDLDSYLPGSPFKINSVLRRDDGPPQDETENTRALQSGFHPRSAQYGRARKKQIPISAEFLAPLRRFNYLPGPRYPAATVPHGERMR